MRACKALLVSLVFACVSVSSLAQVSKIPEETQHRKEGIAKKKKHRKSFSLSLPEIRLPRLPRISLPDIYIPPPLLIARATLLPTPRGSIEWAVTSWLGLYVAYYQTWISDPVFPEYVFPALLGKEFGCCSADKTHVGVKVYFSDPRAWYTYDNYGGLLFFLQASYRIHKINTFQSVYDYDHVWWEPFYWAKLKGGIIGVGLSWVPYWSSNIKIGFELFFETGILKGEMYELAKDGEMYYYELSKVKYTNIGGTFFLSP